MSANSGGFGRIRYATMDYVNYVCQSVYNCYPRWWGGMLVMGGIAVTPIRLSLWDGLCGRMLRSTLTYNSYESYARTYAIRSARGIVRVVLMMK